MTHDEAIASAKGPIERLIIQQLIQYGPWLTNSKAVIIADKLLGMNLLGEPAMKPATNRINELEGDLAIAQAEIKQLEELNEASRLRLDEVSSQNRNMKSGIARRNIFIKELNELCGGLCEVMFHRAEFASLKFDIIDKKEKHVTPQSQTALALVIRENNYENEQPPFDLGSGVVRREGE